MTHKCGHSGWTVRGTGPQCLTRTKSFELQVKVSCDGKGWGGFGCSDDSQCTWGVCASRRCCAQYTDPHCAECNVRGECKKCVEGRVFYRSRCLLADGEVCYSSNAGRCHSGVCKNRLVSSCNTRCGLCALASYDATRRVWGSHCTGAAKRRLKAVLPVTTKATVKRVFLRFSSQAVTPAWLLWERLAAASLAVLARTAVVRAVADRMWTHLALRVAAQATVLHALSHSFGTAPSAHCWMTELIVRAPFLSRVHRNVAARRAVAGRMWTHPVLRAMSVGLAATANPPHG